MAASGVVALLYSMTYGFIAYAVPGKPDDMEVRNWAVYWTILAIFSCCHSVLDYVLSWRFGYYAMKLGFVVALWHPNTQLALWLYNQGLAPFLRKQVAAYQV